MKKIHLSFLSFFFAAMCNAQLSGPYTIPGSYPTLSAAIIDLSAQGVSGPVVFNVTAAQTAPAGGYVIGGIASPLVSTFPSNSTNTVTIQGNSNVVTTLNPQVSGSINDAIFKIIGADYITISNFTMLEDPANSDTALATNNMTEFGVALFYETVTNGAQSNTIQSNTITLDRTYRNTIAVFSTARTNSTLLTTTAEATAASGANSFNNYFSNTIGNANYGIVLVGSGLPAAMDNNNEIGGAGLGNNITNIGNTNGGHRAGFTSVTTDNYVVYSNHQINDSISSNTIANAALANANIVGGINKGYSAANPSGTITTNITGNTITVTNAASGTGNSLRGINNGGILALLSTATFNINNNVFLNAALSGSTTTTGNLFSIFNSSIAGTINILGNQIIGSAIISGSTTTGSILGIYNSTASTTVNMNNNTISNLSITSPTATTAGIYPLRNDGAVGTLNVNDNIVSGMVNSSLARTSGSIIGLLSFGAVTTAVNVNNNQFGNAVTDFATTSNTGNTGVVEGIEISSGAATATLTINNNSVKGITGVNGTQIIGIFVGTGFGNVSVTNNRLGTVDGPFFTFSGATGAGAFLAGILVQGTATTSSLAITGNDVRGFVHAATGASGHSYIENSRVTASHNISNNTFTNIVANTTGGVVFIDNTVSLPAAGTSTVNTNRIVTAFNKTGVGGVVRFYANFGGSPAGTTHTNSANNFSNVTVTGATEIDGWMNHDGPSTAGPIKTISGNTFSNITGGTDTVRIINADWATNIISNNTISNITAADNINGIVLGDNSFSSTANANRITAMSTTGAVNINGINANGTATTTNTMFGNKVCDITLNNVNGGVNGILVVSADSTMIYNNIIGDLKAPTYDGTPDPVRGINIISTQANSEVNVFFNTIYLNATSTGTNFGSTGLYATASATPTTVMLDLRNNIISNNSTSAGAGYTAALKRSGPELNNFAESSNNNLYYAGVPSIDNVIYFDQVTFYQTLAAYKAAVVPRDSSSVTEAPGSTFASTTCGDPNFLHLLAGSVAIDTARVIAGITTDFDLQARVQGTRPDIGADEFVVVVVPVTFEYFRGSKVGGAHFLDWKLNCINEPSVTITLERSSDGRNFKSINEQIVNGNRCLQSFNYTDVNPPAGISYYRVKTIGADGSVKYSVIVTLINKDKGFELISISPNPVKTNAILSLSSVKGGRVDVSVSDVTGRVIMKQSVMVIAGNNPIDMNFTSLGAGTYNITVMNGENETKTARFVKY